MVLATLKVKPSTRCRLGAGLLLIVVGGDSGDSGEVGEGNMGVPEIQEKVSNVSLLSLFCKLSAFRSNYCTVATEGAKRLWLITTFNNNATEVVLSSVVNGTVLDRDVGQKR